MVVGGGGLWGEGLLSPGGLEWCSTRYSVLVRPGYYEWIIYLIAAMSRYQVDNQELWPFQ
jgi:hypothetical protein